MKFAETHFFERFTVAARWFRSGSSWLQICFAVLSSSFHGKLYIWIGQSFWFESFSNRSHSLSQYGKYKVRTYICVYIIEATGEILARVSTVFMVQQVENCVRTNFWLSDVWIVGTAWCHVTVWCMHTHMYCMHARMYSKICETLRIIINMDKNLIVWMWKY